MIARGVSVQVEEEGRGSKSTGARRFLFDEGASAAIEGGGGGGTDLDKSRSRWSEVTFALSRSI